LIPNDLNSWLTYLERLHPTSIELGLERVAAVAGRLGLQRPAKRVITVSGTNGKGSASAFARALLEAGGYKVHVHTSPHLVSWHERYRIGHVGGGRYVEDSVLSDALDRAMQANDDAPITVFEVMTVVTFLLFSEQPADACIIEVGLGGRLDATNVIENPHATLIMSISLDHQDYLGDELEGIALEKAGIIKPGAPLIIGCQQDSRIYDILTQKANETGVKAHIFGQDYLGFEERGRMVFQNAEGLMDLPRPRLAGDFQLANASAAIEAVRLAGFKIDEDIAARAMNNVVWPGRLQKITHGVLRQKLPQNAELWLDGGHNPEAGKMVAQFLRLRQEKEKIPIIMISGMINTKDSKHYFAAFKDLAPRLYTVPVEMSDAGIDPTHLAADAREVGLRACVSSSIEEAFTTITATIDNNQHTLVIICGSLYLVGQALALNNTPPL